MLNALICIHTLKTTIYVLSINTHFFKEILHIFYIFKLHVSSFKTAIKNIWINKMHRECFVESTLVFIRCSQMQILIDRYLKIANSFDTLSKFFAFMQKLLLILLRDSNFTGRDVNINYHHFVSFFSFAFRKYYFYSCLKCKL